MLSPLSVSLCFLACFAAALVYYRFGSKSQRSQAPVPYPPGPRPLPVVGNLFDVPVRNTFLTYTKWGEQYGDVVHITVFGQHIVILNTALIAAELLEKRSRNYSDRPHIPILPMIGWDINTALLPYGDTWRKHRRMFHYTYNLRSITAAQPTICSNAYTLAVSLMNAPQDFTTHLRNYASGVILYLTYGHKIAPKDDPLVRLAEGAISVLVDSMLPGARLVNTFPILEYLPEWCPGGNFKRVARECRQQVQKMMDVPFQLVKSSMMAGTSIPCMATNLLRRSEESGDAEDEETIIKSVAASSFAGGADTTAAVMETFILQMVLHPEVQKRAQIEITAVVGHDRLPSFDDRPMLPYVDAVYHELMRFRPIAPLGLPRAALEDDVYGGLYIPKGAIVMPNIWAMNHDKSIHADPGAFKPDRYLNEHGNLIDAPTPLAYGFGRRICAGHHLADFSIWVAIATLLAVFDIKNAKDSAGRDIDVVDAYSDTVISHPLPFQCEIVPRTERAIELLKKDEAN